MSGLFVLARKASDMEFATTRGRRRGLSPPRRDTLPVVQDRSGSQCRSQL